MPGAVVPECRQLAASQNSNQDATESSISLKARRADNFFPFDGFGRDHAFGGFRAGADDTEAGLFQAVLQGGQYLRIESDLQNSSNGS